MTDQVRRDAAARGLDFGQFGHAALCHGAFATVAPL
jgi:hypothetical protein